MPILRPNEIRRMSQAERERRLTDLRAELVRLRTMAEAGGALDNSSRIREIRRTIARILTIMNEERKG